MPKPPNVVPTRAINVHLPADVAMQLTLHLFSELDGRVPQGAYARFLTPLIRGYFAASHLDLAEWTGAEAGQQVVHGDAATLETLHEILKRGQA